MLESQSAGLVLRPLALAEGVGIRGSGSLPL